MIWFWLILISLGYIYVRLPVFGPGFTDWSFLCLLWGLGLIFVAVREIFRSNAGRFTGTLLAWMLYKIFGRRVGVPGGIDLRADVTDRRYQRMARFGRWLIIIAVVNSFILPLVLSNPLLFSQRYRDLLGPVQESVFSADVEPLDLSQVRIIDEEIATRLADKKIGEVPALGSETRLGRLFLQKVHDKLYYVAPLEHRGVFQWLNYLRTGSHGYVMVSATDPSDVRLVQEIDGQPVRIRYQFGSFLLDYLPRWVYSHGYITRGLTDFTFQLDENLRPFWVVTIYEKKIGYSGDDAAAVLTVDAQTGEITRYSLDSLPGWVSRVQPSGFVYDQIADWGRYIHGFWNSVFAKTGTLRPSSNRMHLIYGLSLIHI
ncbi:MAG: hypothetical protein N3A57_00545, partial [Negativicutes bacterium]|nr:hypothetical protein [Negativicutes bacterium]